MRNGDATERQIVVVDAPRSAGRHVRYVLAQYYGISNPAFPPYHDGEQILNDALFDPVGNDPFVLHVHSLARRVNLETLARRGIGTVVTWRNLGDLVASVEYIIREGGDHTYMYIAPHARSLALDTQGRLEYVIRHAVPWYLNFYLGWRDAGIPLISRYEEMVRDPMSYFTNIVKMLDGTVDEQRLRAIVERGASNESGVRVGTIGHSSDLFSPEMKALLEQTIRSIPADTDELIRELPWAAAGASVAAR